jgi:hypothetical protein
MTFISGSIEVHHLKSDPDEFVAVQKGEKLAEVRRDDRFFEEQDYILLRQTKYSGKLMEEGLMLGYTGRTLMLLITHVHSGIGMKKGYVAISFKVLN